MSQIQLIKQTNFMTEVLTSPIYKDLCTDLFDIFIFSREIGRDPNKLLALQAAAAELILQFQDKRAEFKQEGNELGIAIMKRLILILNRIADCLVWRAFGFDRVSVQLNAEHPQTGLLDRTVLDDFQIAKYVIEKENIVVLVNDLTTILRHGDLTLVGESEISVMENKYGKASKRNQRAARQRKRLEDLLNFLNTEERTIEGRRDFIFRSDVPIKTYHSVVAEAIEGARRTGYSRVDATEAVAIEALLIENQLRDFPAERPFDSVEHIVRFQSLFEKPATRIAPYGIFPMDHRSCFDLMTGGILLVTTLNFDRLQELYNQVGLRLELPQPSDNEIKSYVSASMADRKRLMHLGRFTIRDDNYPFPFSGTPDLFARIGLEFIHEDTIIRADRQLMDFVKDKDLQVTNEVTTRFYIGYRDESNLWI